MASITSLLKSVGNHLRHFWKYWAGAAGTIALVLKLYSPLEALLKQWLVRQVVPASGAPLASFSVTDFAPDLIAWGCIALSVTTGLSIYALVALGQSWGAERTGQRRGTTLVKTFHRTMQAADKIWNRLFPGPVRPLKKVIKCKQVWTIYERGDCNFSETLTLTTADKDIHFMEKGVDSERVAAAAEFPDDIGLKIESTGNGDVAYLINRNDPYNKRFIIFFLPLIKAGGEDTRELEISYYWRGLARGLIDLGEEPFAYQVESADTVPEVEYQFWMKPRMGSFKCVLTGVDLGEDANGQPIEWLESSTNALGMTGWVYRARNLPAGHTTHLRLELKKT